MGSGVIYAVLVVLWAAYFIPRWLRRHEELSESRSVERFDRAMRILSRREPTPDQRYVVMPPRPKAPKPLTRADSTRRTPSVAVRRRRVLAGLLLLTVVLAVATPFSPVPWSAPALGVLAMLGYLVHCRLQARSRRQVSRTRQAVQARSRSRLMRFDAIERLMTVRRELAEERAAEERRWQEAEEAEARLREDEEQRRAAEEAGWQPVPVPLPTYVTKPVVPRTQPVPAARTEAQPDQLQPVEPMRDAPPVGASAAALGHLLDDADEAESALEAILSRRAVND